MERNVDSDHEQKSEDRIDGKTTVYCRTKLLDSRGTPDSVWSFLVLLAGFVSVSIVNGCLYSFGVLLPELMDEFQETRARTATVGSMGTCVGYALSPVTSLSSERFGFRVTSLVFTSLLTVALAVSSITPSLALLYFSYGIVAGTGYSVIHIISVVVVMKHFVKWRSLSSGIIQSSFGVGMLFVSQTTQKLIDWYGWRWAMGGWAMLAFLLLLCGTVFDGRENSNLTKKKWDGKEMYRVEVNDVPTKISVLKNWSLLLYCFSFALCNMVFYVPIVYMVKFSEKHLSISRDHSAQLYIYFSVVVIFSRNIYCTIGSLSFVNRFYLYQFSAAFAGLSVLLLPFSSSYIHLILFMSCLGLLDGGIWGLAPLLVIDVAGIENLNFSWGVFNSVVSVASVSGPPLAGFIADKCDSYDPAFYASGVTLIVASLLMFLRKWAQRHNPQNCRQTLVSSEKDYDEVLKIYERETVL
ncbi:monocarboxylate transporter 9-like [Actinia tenebrosa]|uniref:Monocarboxylate transporter 9-like n=1 Tax=Actinia tenebrosa TaxID=6105 RepID=A0A6P8I4P4_ACTTE|nr:monocarboxylate transporter 9-like [Actinia tenebrosa]